MCKNTLEPAVGCRGPGSSTACGYCKQIEQAQKKPVPPPRKDKPQPKIGVRRPLSPDVAKQLVAETGAKAAPVLVAQPHQIRCIKQPSSPVKLDVTVPPVPPPRPDQPVKLDTTAPEQPPAPKPPPKPLPQPPKPKLVALEVEGACGGPGSWWQVVSPNRTVKVKAVTAPNTKSAWDQLSWGTNVHEVALTAAGPKPVRCTLDGDEKSVLISVHDLTSLGVSTGVNQGAAWKIYESNADVTVTAATAPDRDATWKKLQWKAENGPLKPGAAANERKVALSPPRDVKVSVTLGCSPELGQKKLETTLHICRWPKLEVTKVVFNDARSVVNDGTLEVGKLFDRMWIKGRPDPKANTATATMQSVLRYPKGSAITLEAELTVVKGHEPTEDELVWIHGKTTVKGEKLSWEAQVTVDKKKAKVAFPSTASTGTLPDEVGKFDPMEIEWFQSNAEGTGWDPIGKTKHLLYVTLDERVSGTEPYWTLLDISCAAAAGTKTADEFVPKAFAPFKTHVGDGKGFKRKGDLVELSYYIKGTDTDYDDWALPNSPYHTKGILSRADGTGRCGGWADLLKHMFQLHGIDTAKDYVIIRPRRWNTAKGAWEANYDNRFLVKNCKFLPGTLAGKLPYTHEGPAECVKQSGAPGQGKTNPQFDFGDHVFVDYGGKFYDPSYGIGPIATQFDYEEAAIDGLGAYGSQEKFDQAGTPQHIPSNCSPGYVVRSVSATVSLDDIATKFKTTASVLFNHAINRRLKTKRGDDISQVQVGDVVYVPRQFAKKDKACMLYGYY